MIEQPGRLRHVRAVLEAELQSDSHYPVSVPAQEGERLREWVATESARSTIEVGLGHGVSAAFICLGMIEAGAPTMRHVAMDPNQSIGFAGAGLGLLERAGITDLLEFYAEPSEIVLPRLFSQGRSFDFAFVDGNHRFDGVFVDLAYLGRLLRPSGVIFVDDYQLASVDKAVSFFVGNLGWRVEEASAADPLHGWVVVRTADPPLERRFDQFQDF